MSLQRGSYGIEFDEREGLPLGKLWGGAALILLAVLGVFFFRGCAEDPTVPRPSDEAVGQTRYRLPEAETREERPSLWRHFLRAREQAASADRGASTQQRPGAAKAEAAAQKRGAPAKVQSPELKTLLDRAAERESADDLAGARRCLLQILIRPDSDEVRAFVERKIGALNAAMVFGDRAMPEKVKHRIAPGDVIGKIAKRYGCTQEYVLKANGIDKPELLRIGREVWVLQAPVFELTVFKRASSAVLTLNGKFFKRYDVGLCKPEHAPSGTYVIRTRVKKPAYRTPHGEVPFGSPQNILGAWWVTLAATGDTPEARGFGLHGTWNESLLGRPSAEGRIRFRNADIDELCVLMPDGSGVNVTE